MEADGERLEADIRGRQQRTQAVRRHSAVCARSGRPGRLQAHELMRGLHPEARERRGHDVDEDGDVAAEIFEHVVVEEGGGGGAQEGLDRSGKLRVGAGPRGQGRAGSRLLWGGAGRGQDTTVGCAGSNAHGRCSEKTSSMPPWERAGSVHPSPPHRHVCLHDSRLSLLNARNGVSQQCHHLQGSVVNRSGGGQE